MQGHLHDQKSSLTQQTLAKGFVWLSDIFLLFYLFEVIIAYCWIVLQKTYKYNYKRRPIITCLTLLYKIYNYLEMTFFEIGKYLFSTKHVTF